MPILILGDDGDEHARHMRDYLLTLGHDAEFLDSSRFPVELRIAMDPKTGTGTITLPGGRTIGFEEIQSVYWRTYSGPAAITLPDPEQTMIARHDARSLWESLFSVLRCRWVNSHKAFLLHQCKPAALCAVAPLGVRIPATLVGNDPQAVVRFVAVHPRCIFKPVQGGAYTERLRPEQLSDENLRTLTAAPVTIQEEIEGVDVRVFVAGDEVHACEVRSQSLDFREDPQPEITAITLPADVAVLCVRIARTLDLVWTGIDLRRTPAGEYYFFEANPSPMFLGFERRCGLPLTNALARLLVNR